MKFAQIKPKGLNSMIAPLKDVFDYLNESEIGEEWEIKIVEMTEEEYQKLPEGDGF